MHTVRDYDLLWVGCVGGEVERGGCSNYCIGTEICGTDLGRRATVFLAGAGENPKSLNRLLHTKGDGTASCTQKSDGSLKVKSQSHPWSVGLGLQASDSVGSFCTDDA